MKGVSAVIATILMLLITIAIAGTAYLYITGVFSSRTSVLLSIEPSTTCTNGLITVYMRNSGGGVSGNVNIDIIYPNNTQYSQQCSIAAISAGSINSTSCLVQGSTGYYAIKASGSGSAATGVVFCSSGGGGATTTTTTVSGATTTTTTSSSAPITDTTSSSTAQNNAWGSYLVANAITASASGTTTTVGVFVYTSATGNIRVAIYSDSSGQPGSLLGQSASVAVTANAWNDISVTGVSIVSGTHYWLTFQHDTASQPDVYMPPFNNGIDFWYGSFAYGSFPSSYPTGTQTHLSGDAFDMRMTYH